MENKTKTKNGINNIQKQDKNEKVKGITNMRHGMQLPSIKFSIYCITS